MKLLKAVVTGFTAVAIAALAAVAPLIVIMLKYRATPYLVFGDRYYVVVHWHIWSTLGVSLLVLAAGFYWRYRRSA